MKDEIAIANLTNPKELSEVLTELSKKYSRDKITEKTLNVYKSLRMTEEKEKGSILNLKRTMWDLYKFNFHLGILNKFLGLDFSRCIEYSFAVNKIKIEPHQKILDVGETPYGFFPLYLASKGSNVIVIDIDKNVKKIKEIARQKRLEDKIDVVVASASKLPFLDSTLDVIFNISTIEHIPYDGDVQTLEETGRVLKKRGKTFISTSYGSNYSESKWGRWFFRTYDYKALNNRLIKPSGLKIIETGYFEDNVTRNFTNLLYKLPRLIRFSLGWLHIFFAKYYVAKDKAAKDNANLVWVLLERIFNES